MKNDSFVSKKKGFTLVELIVVIAIVAILSAIIMSNLNQARAKSRDGKRVADISQLQIGLALYLNKNGAYPIVSTGAESGLQPLVTGSFIPLLPVDPTNDSTHQYHYNSTDGTTYCIWAEFEMPNSYLDPNVNHALNANCPASADGLTYQVQK